MIHVKIAAAYSLLRFPTFIVDDADILSTSQQGLKSNEQCRRKKQAEIACLFPINLLMRSIRSMSVASSMVALLLSADSLIALLPL